jgi:fibronectin-binding autotransporter adhesin
MKATWWVLAAVLAVIGATLVAVPDALAAERRWDGGANESRWSHPDNWEGNVLPAAGDDLHFPPFITNLVAVNDFPADTAFNSITITGSNYIISGQPIRLAAGLSSAFNNSYRIPTTLTAPQTWRGSLGHLTITTPIALDGNTLTFDASGTVTVNGVIGSGPSSVGIVKENTGTLELTAANSYRGPTTVNAGTLKIAHAGALGTPISGPDGGTTVASGATLQIEGSLNVAEPLTLNGTGVGGAGALLCSGTGTSTWAGAVTLATDAAVGVQGNTTLSISGAIGGPGGLTKVGNSELVLAGAVGSPAPNTYQGLTRVNEGQLSLDKPAGTPAIPGNVIVGDQTGPGTDVLKLFASDQIADGAQVTVNSTGRFDLFGRNETIHSLAGDGEAWLGATSPGSTLTLNIASSSATFSGVLSRTGALVKKGIGTQTLAGNNTYSGPTTVSEGTLRITHGNALGSTTEDTAVHTAATLRIVGGITVAEPLTLSGVGFGSTGALDSGEGVNTWSGPITLATTATVNLGAADRVLTVSGAIGGPAGLTKTGSGLLALTGDNSYSGATIVTDGVLRITHANALGTPPGGAPNPGTLVQGGATLQVASGLTVAEPLVLDGAGHAPGGGQGALESAGGANTWSGPVAFGSDTRIGVPPTSPLTISGTIGGTGGLTLVGTGVLTLSGNNTYSGSTHVGLDASLTGGTLKVTHDNALGKPPTGPNGGTTVASGATLQTDGSRLAIDEPLTLNGTGVGGLGALRTSPHPNPASVDLTVWLGSITLASDAAIAVPTGSHLNVNGLNGGSIGGPGGLTKLEAGVLTLAGDNTYQGRTIVSAGAVVTERAAALGTPPPGIVDPGTIVQAGATLRILVGATYAEPLTLNGAGVNGQGALRSQASNAIPLIWAAPITLASDTTIGATGEPFTIQGRIDGPGSLTMAGLGTLVLAGNVANTYAGTTHASGAQLRLNKSAGVTAVPGDLLISSRVTLLASEQIADTVTVTVNASGQLDLGGAAETVAALAGTGQVLGMAPAGFTVGATNASSTFAGTLTGTGGALIKAGTGTLTLSGNNTYSGPTTVQAGTLLVTGALTDSAVTLTGGTLAGAGSVKGITASGGAVSPGTNSGILRSTGNVALQAGATFAVELNGTTPGSGHDQLDVTGTVNLGNATLQATLGFTPAIGNQIVIIRNDGTDAVQGIFQGFHEGALVTIGGQGFQISYRGGDGNDVVLTRAAPCAVRPNVRLPVEPTGDGRLRVTVHAGADVATNGLLQSLQFTRLDNAVVEIGTQVGVTGTYTLSPPAPSLTLYVRRATAGQTTTVELRVTDTCGVWPTLVGGGPTAF